MKYVVSCHVMSQAKNLILKNNIIPKRNLNTPKEAGSCPVKANSNIFSPIYKTGHLLNILVLQFYLLLSVISPHQT